jgi:hypothetical protein
MILAQRKKCPNMACRWIGTTTEYNCPMCREALFSAASKSLGNEKRIGVIRNGKYIRLEK